MTKDKILNGFHTYTIDTVICPNCDYSFKKRTEYKKLIVEKGKGGGVGDVDCPSCKKKFRYKVIPYGKLRKILISSDCRLNKSLCDFIYSENEKIYKMQTCKNCDNFKIKR